MRNVLIFKETLLPPSETFILAQMHALREYLPLLAGLERSERSLPLEHPLLLTGQSGALAGYRAKLYRKTGIAPGFHRAARRFQPHLVHAHFASGGQTAIALARALQVPLVVTLHGSDVTVHGAAEKYKQLAGFATRFLCVSEFIRGRALAAGFPAEKLELHYIGIDRAQFAPAETATPSGVLFVGRMVEKKGCEYLLRAMQIVQQTNPGARLTMIGDGPLRAQLEALANELRVDCKFLGVLPAAAVRDHLKLARVFCVPSVTAANGDSEGLPTVIAEAQATGIPVVGSIHAGIPEIVVDGVTGFLTAEREYRAIAAALTRLLEDDVLWQQFRSASVARIKEHFDLATQTALLERIYTSALMVS